MRSFKHIKVRSFKVTVSKGTLIHTLHVYCKAWVLKPYTALEKNTYAIEFQDVVVVEKLTLDLFVYFTFAC